MEEKQENVVEETTQQESPVKEEPKIDNTVEKIKVKKKPTMKKLSQDDEPIKVDMSKPPKTKEDEQPVDVTETEGVQEKVVEETTGEKEVVESSIEETTETPVLEEITGEEVEEVQEQIEEAVVKAEATGEPLPENIQKLMDFMKDTGGDINDYVKLNQDYSDLNNDALLKEYYTQTKPHLNTEEINFLMEDNFSYDEDVDDERDIKRKKLALKEQVADAKSHLDGQKSKYYEDIKAGSKLTTEQQKAIDFFNRYNKESEENQKAASAQVDEFLNETNKVFNDKFKGFEYKVGEKKFRFNVNNANEVKENQSDINNFIKKFLNKNDKWENAKGYHKSLYTAMNADAVANHFYEQGKTDAMKNSVAKAKNVNMKPRQAHGENIETGGLKFKVLGEDSSDFKFKIKQK
jgi:hypothetical protein